VTRTFGERRPQQNDHARKKRLLSSNDLLSEGRAGGETVKRVASETVPDRSTMTLEGLSSFGGVKEPEGKTVRVKESLGLGENPTCSKRMRRKAVLSSLKESGRERRLRVPSSSLRGKGRCNVTPRAAVRNKRVRGGGDHACRERISLYCRKKKHRSADHFFRGGEREDRFRKGSCEGIWLLIRER